MIARPRGTSRLSDRRFVSASAGAVIREARPGFNPRQQPPRWPEAPACHPPVWRSASRCRRGPTRQGEGQVDALTCSPASATSAPLLTAASTAMCNRELLAGGIHLDVTLTAPTGRAWPDATNLLGAIGDVLQRGSQKPRSNTFVRSARLPASTTTRRSERSITEGWRVSSATSSSSGPSLRRWRAPRRASSRR